MSTKPTYEELSQRVRELERNELRHKKLEKALRASEERFYLTFRLHPDAINLSSISDGTYIDVNEGFTRMTGFTREEVIGKTSSLLNIWKNPADRERMVRELAQSGFVENFEAQFVTKSGKIRVGQIFARIIRIHDEDVILSITRDITEYKRTEAARIKSERKYRTLFEHSLDGIGIVTIDGQFLDANPAFCELFGYSREEIRHLNAGQLYVNPADRHALIQSYQNDGYIKNQKVRMRKKDGTQLICQISGTIQVETESQQAIIYSITRDMTAYYRMEDQLRQAQKMESVGRLAGGVAHDYNNALSAIIGFTELAIDSADPEGPLRGNLNEVLHAAKHATEITRQLLAFARKQTIAPKVLDLNDNIENVLKMIRHLIGENIDLSWIPGAGLWPVNIDPTQIDQILANLCVNARDAIEDVGKVTIETGNVTLDETYCANHAGFVPGEFVLMAVSDNGSGMEKEILDNIFEPFFTTKDVDKGTGLGMATVYGIVKQNRGFINVYSEPGIGTSIKIYLPRYKGNDVETQQESVVDTPQSHGETILLVEDDLSVLKLAQQILNGLGYTVLAVSTPGDALDLVKEHTGEIHLLITDVIMPEMNGREMADRLQAVCPGLKCMFMSGYTTNAIVHSGVLDDKVQFLQKPFSKKDLIMAVRKALNESSNLR